MNDTSHPHVRPRFLYFSTQDRILFAKRLSMMLRSGLPILDGLTMLSADARSRSARFIYATLIGDVSSGIALSRSLQKFPRQFDEFSVSITRVGEASGTLHENLEYLAEELKRKQALRRKVIGALVYPAVIIVATITITILLTVYIFPKIIPVLQSVKAQLPISTRILMTVSYFLSHRGWWLLFAVVITTGGLIALNRFVNAFHRGIDRMLLYIPLLGNLSRFYNLANCSRTLSLLLKSDVRIVPSIELVAASTHNLIYKEQLSTVRKKVIEGQKLAPHLMRSPRLFPALFTQMITVGESTGNLSATLGYLSDMYEEEINELTKNLTTLLEPVLMIVMGTIVGFIAISIISPIYSITQTLTPH